MKVISLLQPWATLVAIGAKKIETRSWSTHYRGPLAIHASKKLDRNAALALVIEPTASLLAAAGVYRMEHYHPGSILCVCDLVDVVSITEDNAPPEPERSFGNYSLADGPRYAWRIPNVRALPEPIPAKGALGLWTPEPDELEQLRRFCEHGKGAV